MVYYSKSPMGSVKCLSYTTTNIIPNIPANDLVLIPPISFLQDCWKYPPQVQIPHAHH